MSEHIVKRHNKNLLMYHFVLTLKYRRKAVTASVGDTLKAPFGNSCLSLCGEAKQETS
jgi:REP element-mobilizing transposase RayT